MSAFGEIVAGYFDYETLKILHLFGIIIFMGNIIITGWWKVMADRTGDYRVIAFAQRQVTLTDWLFTFGGVMIALVAAFGMVYHMNNDLMAEIYATRWLWWGYHLFLVSGIIWVVVLVPMQILQARMAHKFSETGEIPDRYRLYGKIWLWFGILATIVPMVNIYWMVVKA
jgi:uncharacterized membrane protein